MPNKIHRIADKDIVIISTRLTPLEKARVGESPLEEEFRRKKRMGQERLAKYRTFAEIPGLYGKCTGTVPGNYFPQFSANDDDVCVYSSVVFCPVCRKMAELHQFAVLKDEIPEDILSDPFLVNRLRYCDTQFDTFKEYFEPIAGSDPDKDSSYIRKCPHCGTDLSSYIKEEMEHRRPHLWEYGAREGKNARLLGWDVHQKEEKIVMRLVYQRYSIDTMQEEVHSGIFSAAVTVNMETGRTFALAPHSSGWKKLFWSKGSPVQEITYGTDIPRSPEIFEPIAGQQDMLDAAWDILCREKNVKKAEDTSFLSLVCINRFGGNARYLMKSYIKGRTPYEFNIDNLTARKAFSKIPFSVLPDIHTVLSALKLPDRPGIRRMITERPETLSGLVCVKRMGFRNYDYLIQAADVVTGWTEVDDVGSWQEKDALRFCKKLIKVRGEPSVFRALFRTAGREDDDLDRRLQKNSTASGLLEMLSDCEHMDARCINNGITPELAGGSLQEIHNELCVLVNDLSRVAKQREIPYGDDELRLEGEVDGYTFLLPKNTGQIVQIGQKMSNCVSTYAAWALSGYCIIVSMFLDNTDQICGCIELRHGKQKHDGRYVLVQAKGKYNQQLRPHEEKAVLSWMEANSISDKSTDLQNAEAY